MTIHFACSDALSGIGTGGCPGDYTLTGNGANQSYSDTATDQAGNTGTATYRVYVPHDQGQGTAIDDGPHYTVTQP